MKIKLLFYCGIVGINLSTQTSADDLSDSLRSSIIGSYESKGNSRNTLQVFQQQEGYRIELVGGGENYQGAATSADCVVHATGKLKGNLLTANFTAVETDTFLYTDDQAKEDRRTVKINFSRGRATVSQADTLSYCGYTANFVGIYRRKIRP